jgi:segregation and condensation protein B
MNPDDIKAIAESLLFASGSPLSLRQLVEVIGVTPVEVKSALVLLSGEYAAPGRGVCLVQVAGGYQFRTVPEYAEYVKILVREKPNRLSRAALETLAIIAYRQPLTKIEIEAVRGVDVDGVLNSLLSKKLIRAMGRKDVPGRPWVYGTTPQFLELFGLSELGSLPPLPEIHEPTINPYGETDTAGTITEDSQPGGSGVSTDSRDVDPDGEGAGERRDDHALGNDSGRAT